MAAPLAEVTLVEVTLADVGPEHEGALRAITRHAATMKWIANGVAWSGEKLRRFLKYCAEEAGQPRAERENYYSAVLAGGECVGVVGVHPVNYEPGVRALTVFVAPAAAGKKVGTRAIRLALAAYWAHSPGQAVCVDVNVKNAPMNALATSLGLERERAPVKISGKEYHRYTATSQALPASPASAG